MDVYLLVYVNYMLILGNNMVKIVNIMGMLCSEFEMKYLGKENKILSIQIIRGRRQRRLMIYPEAYF